MNTELWTAYEAAAATGGALCARGGPHSAEDLPEETWVARGLSIDSRTIRPGELFVALNDRRDGHDFVHNAFDAGASAALVSRAPKNTPDGAPLLVVNDTLSGLQSLASAARDRCFGKLVAVTGSAGKTSTKEQLRDALGAYGKVHAATSSFNNHYGVPLTLAALPGDADYGVFEIGMNHAGEITPLTELVQPHVAIVTTVAPAHLEFFDSVRDIAFAKAEIFSGLRPNGYAILPRDNEYYSVLSEQARTLGATTGAPDIVTFGRDSSADVRLVSYDTQDGCARIRVNLMGAEHTVMSGIPGIHQAENMLAVLAVISVLNLPIEPVLEAYHRMRPVAGRGLIRHLKLDGKSITLIDESYNANPASMRAAITNLASFAGKGRKIALLGEMKELGEDEVLLHKALADDLRSAGIDRVFAAGDLMKPMLEALPANMRGEWAKTASDFVSLVMTDLRDGDVLMAKGSNASRVTEFVSLFCALSEE